MQKTLAGQMVGTEIRIAYFQNSNQSLSY